MENRQQHLVNRNEMVHSGYELYCLLVISHFYFTFLFHIFISHFYFTFLFYDVVYSFQVLAHLFIDRWHVLCSGSLPPVVAYDKNGIRILLHFGKDQPRPDVQVMALSTMSTNTHPITNFSFQAAVPKVSTIT